MADELDLKLTISYFSSSVTPTVLIIKKILSICIIFGFALLCPVIDQKTHKSFSTKL